MSAGMVYILGISPFRTELVESEENDVYDDDDDDDDMYNNDEGDDVRCDVTDLMLGKLAKLVSI